MAARAPLAEVRSEGAGGAAEAGDSTRLRAVGEPSIVKSPSTGATLRPRVIESVPPKPGGWRLPSPRADIPAPSPAERALPFTALDSVAVPRVSAETRQGERNARCPVSQTRQDPPPHRSSHQPSWAARGRQESGRTERQVAVFLTNIVGSMWCAYVFAIIAFLGLRPALKPGGEGIIAWIAQTFLQLVLLSVIMVGQNVQSVASDIRSQHTYDDTVEILDRLDIHTAGGLRDLADRIESLEAKLSAT